jgi:hypothetical protein
MSIETELQTLTSTLTTLTTNVSIKQTGVNTAVALIADTVNKVNTELNLVDNVADADKEVSTPQQTAIALKQNTLVNEVNIASVNGQSLLGGGQLVVARGQVEMPVIDYDDRANLRSPIAPVPDTGDVVNIHHLGMFQYIALADYTDPYFEDDEMVYDAVDPVDGVTLIGQWVMTIPGHGFIEAQELFEKAILWDWMDDSNLDG